MKKSRKSNSAAIKNRAAILLTAVTAGIVANKGFAALNQQSFMQSEIPADAVGFAKLNLKKAGVNMAIAVAAGGLCLNIDSTIAQVAAAQVAAAAVNTVVVEAGTALNGLGSTDINMYDSVNGVNDQKRILTFAGNENQPLKFQ